MSAEMKGRTALWPVLAAPVLAAGASIVDAAVGGPVTSAQTFGIVVCWGLFGFSLIAEARGDTEPHSSHLKLGLWALLSIVITVVLLAFGGRPAAG
jgi:drug/metabolite transporter (DMT)-like permease